VPGLTCLQHRPDGFGHEVYDGRGLCFTFLGYFWRYILLVSENAPACR
jgi:hypothetical protein